MWIRQKGFTLVELMVTVAVLAVFVGVAIPNFSTMILNNRSVAFGEELTSALAYARTEAVRRSARVSVCGSSNGTSCTGGTEWRVGFIVYVDTAATDTTATTTVGNVLKVWQAQDLKARMSVKRNGVDVTFFRFTGLGVLARNNLFNVDIVTELSGCKNNNARTTTVSLAGQVSVQRLACW